MKLKRLCYLLTCLIIVPPFFGSTLEQNDNRLEITQYFEFETEKERSELDRVTRVRTTRAILVVRNVSSQVINGPLQIVLDTLRSRSTQDSSEDSTPTSDGNYYEILKYGQQTWLNPGETVKVPIELAESPKGKARKFSSKEKVIGISGRKSAAVHVYQLINPN